MPLDEEQNKQRKLEQYRCSLDRSWQRHYKYFVCLLALANTVLIYPTVARIGVLPQAGRIALWPALSLICQAAAMLVGAYCFRQEMADVESYERHHVWPPCTFDPHFRAVYLLHALNAASVVLSVVGVLRIAAAF